MHESTIATETAAPARASFTACPTALHDAAKFLAGKIIDKRPNIPVLAFVHIAADIAGSVTLTANNLDIMATIELAGEVDSPGEFCVDAKAFADALAKLKKDRSCYGATVTDEMRFNWKGEQESARVTVKGGGTRAAFNLPGLPADDFPALAAPTVGKRGPMPLSRLAVPAPEFFADMRALAPCIGRQESRYYLNGIALETRDMAGRERLVMVATDGQVMGVASRAHFAGSMPQGLVHHKAVAALIAGEKLTGSAAAISIDHGGEGAGRFRFTAGALSITAKAIDATFPQWELPWADGLAPIEAIEGPMFPDLLPGTPTGEMERLAKAVGAIEWTDARSGKVGTVPGDDGIIFGVYASRKHDNEPAKGYRYGHDANDEIARRYLSDLAKARHPGTPADWQRRLICDGDAYHGMTFGKSTWIPARYEERPNFETLTMDRVEIPASQEWAEGSFSLLMPGAMQERRADVTVEVEGDATVYPVATNSAGKIHLSAAQVRALTDCPEAWAVVEFPGPDGKPRYINRDRWEGVVRWSDGELFNLFGTVQKNGRTFPGEGEGETFTRAEIEAALAGETIAVASDQVEAVETPAICPPAGAQGEIGDAVALDGLEPENALSGPEIAIPGDNGISDNGAACDDAMPEAQGVQITDAPGAEICTHGDGEVSKGEGEADVIAALLERVAALEERLDATLPAVSTADGAPTVEIGGKGEKIEVAPTGGKAARTPAHERAIRRAWAERRRVRGLREGIAFEHHCYEAERLRNGELADELHKTKGQLASTQSALEQWHNEGLAGYEAVRSERAKRRRAVLKSRDLQTRLFAEYRLVDGISARKADAVAIERARADTLAAQLASAKSDLDAVRAVASDPVTGQNRPDGEARAFAHARQAMGRADDAEARLARAMQANADLQSAVDRLGDAIEAANLRAIRAEQALAAVTARRNGWPPAVRDVSVTFGAAA